MSIQGSELIDWDELIIELLSCPADFSLNDSPTLKPDEELAIEVVARAIDDAKIPRPDEKSERLPDQCCPACFLIDTLQDPDCIWGQSISSHGIHPRVIKRWAEKNAIHWCQGEKPAGKVGRPKMNLFPEPQIQDHREDAA